MMLPPPTTNKILPLFLFSSLSALGLKLIFSHVFNSGLHTILQPEAQCPPSLPKPFNASRHPNRLAYSGYDSFDEFLCPFVAFFQFVLESNEREPLPRLYLSYFIVQSLPGVTFWLVEMLRYRISLKGRRWVVGTLITSFWFWGAIFQVVTLGATVPLFCLAYILSGMASGTSSPKDTKGQTDRKPMTEGTPRFTKRHAEAVLFGLIMGSLIPSVGMVSMNDPRVTALWQFFPFFVSGSQSLYLAVRRPKVEQDGKGLLILMYALSGIVAASMHIVTSWRALGAFVLKGDQEAFKFLRAYWFPAKLYGSAWTSPAGKTLELLHWDGLFSCVSALLVTFWFARAWKTVASLAVWYVVAVPLFGPGAAMAVVYIWKELRLDLQLSL